MPVSADSSRRTGTRSPGEPPWVAMYHSVGDCSDDPYRVTVSPERLGLQLDWLRRRGLRGVCVRDLLAARARGEGRDLVGLTFDDGYADFVEAALPLLRHHGFGATLFVLSGRLDGDNAWDRWARANRCWASRASGSPPPPRAWRSARTDSPTST